MQLATTNINYRAIASAVRYLDRALTIADSAIPVFGGESGRSRLNPAPMGLSAARTARQAVQLLELEPDFVSAARAIANAQEAIALFEQFAIANPQNDNLSSTVSLDPYLRAVELLFDARDQLHGF